jgi:hypothetical protein
VKPLIYGPGGSVLSIDESEPVVGAQLLDHNNAVYYGGRWMLCESATEEFARWIALHLGRELVKP